NRERLIKGLSGLGFNLKESETPIIPLIFDDIDKVLLISRSLEEKGIYVPAIRPPTVKMPRLRITVTASHTEDDIKRLVEGLKTSLV
ncbi:MAG: aminotransferase class I/II-fold pyridoxal phosphate-dependent enzyme, partial [Thermodesulfovibrionales bacterium]